MACLIWNVNGIGYPSKFLSFYISYCLLLSYPRGIPPNDEEPRVRAVAEILIPYLLLYDIYGYSFSNFLRKFEKLYFTLHHTGANME